MLVREMHIGIDIGLQKMNSEKLEDFGPEEKDWVLNEIQLRHIKNRSSRKSNPKKDGLQDTVKRYEDIEDLIETASLPVYKKDSETMFALLPQDHFILLDNTSEVIYDCNGITKTEGTTTKKISVVPFKEDLTKLYEEYNLAYDDGTGLVTIFDMQDYAFTENATVGGGLKDNEERFYIVAHVKEIVNRIDGLEVRWENYNGKYYPNSFIFVTDTQGALNITATLQVGNVEVYNFSDLTFTTYSTNTPVLKKYPHRLVKTDDLRHLMNHSFGTTKYSSPLTTRSKKILNLFHNERFIFNRLHVEYIRKPRLISLSLNQSCSLNEALHEEIVDEAVQLIKARINDVGYRNIINENLIKE